MEKLIPPNEKERLRALQAYDILDTFPEEDLDAITRLASEICQTPIALISLIDKERQWFKANVGLNAAETPRDISFCQHTILGDTVFQVKDAEQDPQFANNVLVTGKPDIRFYAGAPLISPEGFKLGSLCVIDTVPKELSDYQKRSLETLSALVINQFELRRKKTEVEEAKNHFHRMLEEAGDIIYTTNETGHFQYISNAISKITGYTVEELKDKDFNALVAPESKQDMIAFYRNQVNHNIKETNFEFRIVTKDGTIKWIEQNVVMIVEGSVFKGFQGVVRDVTIRKDVETKLAEASRSVEETKKTLQSILDNTSSVIFIKDLKYRYTLVNKSFEKIFGVNFDDVYLKSDYDFRDEKDADILRKNDMEVFKRKKLLDFEHSFTIKGVRRTFLITKFPLYDDSGFIEGICGVYAEITAQKKVHALLRERDERFSKIFHASPAPMYLSTVNPSRLVEVNQSFIDLTGYDPKKILGKNSLEIGMLNADEREKIVEYFAKTGSLKNYEVTFYDKSGKKHYALLSSETVEIDGKKHVLSLYYDITARKQSEKELASARSLLVEAMSIGRMGTFENNVGEQKVTWSKEVYDIMEMPYQSEPLTYDEYVNSIHPADLDIVIRKIEDTLKNKLPDVTINRFITKKGKTKWIETRVVPILNEAGDIFVFRGTMQDITELKETEQQLRGAKEVAEQSVIAKEQFLANMSHEIRTPMNGVLGFTDLLIKTKLDREQKGFVHAIETSGKNLMALINDILDYSKIEAGMMSIDETPLSIRGIFSSLFVLFNDRVKKKKIKLSFKSDKNIPEIVIGDPVRLTQIITNLVGNSIKFTEEGSVGVSAKLLEETNEKVRIQFSVKDTGIGIEKEKLTSVFERFNQGSNDTTRKYGGTGLGLSIVKKLAELQGGGVSVESTLKKGSVFYVEISYKKAGPEKNMEPVRKNKTTGAKSLARLSILLVEDNRLNQKLAEKVLLDFGFDVDIAANGKIAVNKIKKTHYDLVLMDMQMPEMNGYEATTMIREKLQNNTPIIAMTAHAMGSEKERCLALGMNDYISKPFKADDLYNKIATIYKQHKLLPGVKKRAVTTTNKERVIDLTYLKSITDGNKEFIDNMLELFVEQVPGDLYEITTAIAEKNYAVIKSIAHKLKSSVPIVGIEKELLPVLVEMEQMADKKTGLPVIKKLFTSLKKVCNDAIKEIIFIRANADF